MDNYKTQGCCVYKHTSPSNKVYIGMTTVQPEERWNNGWGYKKQPFFNAILKCGHISDCLNGRLKTSKGYEWKYV